MSTPQIMHETNATGGRYFIKLEGSDEAIMTYTRRDPKTIIVNHTGVPNAYRGRGIALDLVRHGVAEARANGEKIVPQCSYVGAQFRRHPDWADVLAD